MVRGSGNGNRESAITQVGAVNLQHQRGILLALSDPLTDAASRSCLNDRPHRAANAQATGSPGTDQSI